MEKPSWATVRGKVALATYTLIRIVANIYVVAWCMWNNKLRQGEAGFTSCDAVARPLITAVGVHVFLQRQDRFCAALPLHIWSRRAVICLASFHCDASMLFLANWACIYYRINVPRFAHSDCLALIWEVACNVMQVHMTNLKLQALGLHMAAAACAVLTACGCGACASFFVLLVVGVGKEELLALPLRCALLCNLLTLLLQCCGLVYAASRAITMPAPVDEEIKSTACFLYINSVLVVVGPALTLVAVYNFAAGGQLTSMYGGPAWLTLDVALQVSNVLLLSGLIGPRQWNQPMRALEALADFSGFGLAAKRIAFPGQINQTAAECIASFPGKYGDLWDQAVSSVKHQQGCSLACVFLTDSDSGLGKHAENPDTPGQCWCHSLYGQVGAAAYFSVVEEPADEADNPAWKEKLAFKRADAMAMGQRLLIKRDQTDIIWQQEFSDALRKAEDLCAANHGRAPWGCQWFHEWKINIEQALQLKQSLHIFYYAGRKGRGKMRWHELSDNSARESVRPISGLGASQTAEVAYLDRIGASYVEHDIRDFEAFMATSLCAVSHSCPSP
ncbi:unnamed protein product [Symbiodinium natans]|uniref:Uncharacterized protein n=1 Tax=Symbiodinium natans TaxID=878477 RepID=A0A812NZ68_9DINO|nr:unnamed protein product [Symbiodinium natans]